MDLKWALSAQEQRIRIPILNNLKVSNLKGNKTKRRRGQHVEMSADTRADVEVGGGVPHNEVF